MATYELTANQKGAVEKLGRDFKNTLDTRLDLWNKLTPEVQLKWKRSCPEPILAEAIAMYRYLKKALGDIDDATD